MMFIFGVHGLSRNAVPPEPKMNFVSPGFRKTGDTKSILPDDSVQASSSVGQDEHHVPDPTPPSTPHRLTSSRR